MTIELSRHGDLAIVKLARPEKLNALNPEMRMGIASAFDETARDESVRAVILTSVGKAFCSSGDVSTMGDFSPESARERLALAHRMILAIANHPKPVIAAVRGAVAGIGWSMALACDLIIASRTARFIQVFRNVGLVPDGGSIYFLRQQLGLQRAKELVYSARALPAEEAHALGLITALCEDSDLESVAQERAASLARGPRLAFGVSKRLFQAASTPSLESFLDMEMWAQTTCLLGKEHREGVAAFMEKRAPNF